MKEVNLSGSGKRIREAVKRKGFSVHYCADKLHVTDQAFYHYQSGKCMPSLDNLINLADILGEEIEDLLVCDERGDH